METNINAASQIILIKKVMMLENVSFSKAIEIIDTLKQENLLNYYMHSMYKEDFENDKIFDNI